MGRHPDPRPPDMDRPSVFRRASGRALSKLRKTLSKENTHRDDNSSISQRSYTRSLFSVKSIFTTTTVEVDKPIPEVPEIDLPDNPQTQSPFFRKLPPEVRDQIYREYFIASGVERHVFLIDRKLYYSPCVTQHAAPDERQEGLAKDFRPSPDVQHHPEWFARMKSKWCNHWRCEKLWEDIQAGRAVDFNAGSTQGFMGLLLSCKRVYCDSIERFRESQVLNITDGSTVQRITKLDRPSYLARARYVNLSLRHDSGSWLYLNGIQLWHVLAEPQMRLRRFYLWLDAECPVTRRLLPEFRELYEAVTEEIGPRLTIDFPCDAGDGFWAWRAGVRRDGWMAGCGPSQVLGEMVPRFTVVARGRPRFNETSCGFVSRADLGRPKVRVLKEGNPFEDVQLYGRGFYDDGYA